METWWRSETQVEREILVSIDFLIISLKLLQYLNHNSQFNRRVHSDTRFKIKKDLLILEGFIPF